MINGMQGTAHWPRTAFVLVVTALHLMVTLWALFQRNVPREAEGDFTAYPSAPYIELLQEVLSWPLSIPVFWLYQNFDFRFHTVLVWPLLIFNSLLWTVALWCVGAIITAALSRIRTIYRQRRTRGS